MSSELVPTRSHHSSFLSFFSAVCSLIGCSDTLSFIFVTALSYFLPTGRFLWFFFPQAEKCCVWVLLFLTAAEVVCGVKAAGKPAAEWRWKPSGALTRYAMPRCSDMFPAAEQSTSWRSNGALGNFRRKCHGTLRYRLLRSFHVATLHEFTATQKTCEIIHSSAHWRKCSH